MKLRRPFAPLQLLFLVIVAFGAVETGFGQDRIVTRDGMNHDGKIAGMSGANVELQVGAGTIGYPLGNVAQVIMTTPPEVAAAISAYQAKDYKGALASATAVTEKFKGLPTDWAREATALLGDIYVALNDPAKAEAAYAEFQKIYPGGSPAQSLVGLARLAALKKDWATVKEKIEPVAAEALKQENAPKESALAYSQAFYLLGQAKEAEGDRTGALEDYLRTVTLFPQDRIAAGAARERADALEKTDGVTVP